MNRAQRREAKKKKSPVINPDMIDVYLDGVLAKKTYDAEPEEGFVRMDGHIVILSPKDAHREITTVDRSEKPKPVRFAPPVLPTTEEIDRNLMQPLLALNSARLGGYTDEAHDILFRTFYTFRKIAEHKKRPDYVELLSEMLGILEDAAQEHVSAASALYLKPEEIDVLASGLDCVKSIMQVSLKSTMNMFIDLAKIEIDALITE